MTLSACTMAEAKRRSGSSFRMSARAQKTFRGPSSRDSLRSMRDPLRCSSRPPRGPRNLHGCINTSGTCHNFCKSVSPKAPLCKRHTIPLFPPTDIALPGGEAILSVASQQNCSSTHYKTSVVNAAWGEQAVIPRRQGEYADYGNDGYSQHGDPRERLQLSWSM